MIMEWLDECEKEIENFRENANGFARTANISHIKHLFKVSSEEASKQLDFWLFWIRPKEPVTAPYSELSMYCAVAGKEIKFACRTGEDYGYIITDGGMTHGLLSEVIPYGSELYNNVKQSAIIKPSLVCGGQ